MISISAPPVTFLNKEAVVEMSEFLSTPEGVLKFQKYLKQIIDADASHILYMPQEFVNAYTAVKMNKTIGSIPAARTILEEGKS